MRKKHFEVWNIDTRTKHFDGQCIKMLFKKITPFCGAHPVYHQTPLDTLRLGTPVFYWLRSRVVALLLYYILTSKIALYSNIHTSFGPTHASCYVCSS